MKINMLNVEISPHEVKTGAAEWGKSCPDCGEEFDGCRHQSLADCLYYFRKKIHHLDRYINKLERYILANQQQAEGEEDRAEACESFEETWIR